MAKEAFEPSIEAIEATPEERRDEAWNTLQALIIDGTKLPPAFDDTLHTFAQAHIDVLIDQHHHEEAVEPYEFMREKLAKMKSIRPERRMVIFSKIRAAVTNRLATRAVDRGQKCNIEAGDEIIIFYGALSAYIRLLLSQESKTDDIEKNRNYISRCFGR